MEEMQAHRTPGRRRWETHWAVWSTWIVTLLALVFAVFFLYSSYRQVKDFKINPHFKSDHCFECHEARGSKMKAEDCYGCHDLLTRALLPNARQDLASRFPGRTCVHPLKINDPARGRSSTALCLSCHSGDKAFVAMVNVETNTYVEIDMTLTHPIGMYPTETVQPATLPLSDAGQINCITCHDQHSTDRRLHLLRLYHPGNGRPADFRPLCNDCHRESWIPLGPKIADSVRESHELREQWNGRKK